MVISHIIIILQSAPWSWSSLPLLGDWAVSVVTLIVPRCHPSLPTKVPPSIALQEKQQEAQCQEKERKFSPDLDGRSTGATLARCNLVRSRTPVLRRSLHHQEHDQRHQSPHYRWHSYHCSHFRSAPVELSHGSCIAPATSTCLRGIVRSRMVGANSFTRHTGNSSRQL